MIKSIENIMNEVIEKYFDDESLCKTKENKQKMMESIIREKIKKIKTKNFWYINSSKNVCTHIFSKGKKQGYMCHKKITENGDKKKFVCTKHNPNHTPKKGERENKNIIKRAEKKINDTKKIKKRKIKKVYICNGGILNFTDVINKIIK